MKNLASDPGCHRQAKLGGVHHAQTKFARATQKPVQVLGGTRKLCLRVIVQTFSTEQDSYLFIIRRHLPLVLGISRPTSAMTFCISSQTRRRLSGE